ncbi:putative membrane protein [Streptomyces ambofaciens ATCC 23877]|uniref:Putative membrane protein n=1 Tax=Streptomyces ambofaciens (strain ATCC 23877 / 3486 / DSM 40053 / JCM 4204 / NBRC 12836 / NRRL B-2516) TaxID=278992 RepID=A0A0K2B0G8_STRA7|nr:putative membrane protein [Streptomyces ambofaciens ATCC 23877]
MDHRGALDPPSPEGSSCPGYDDPWYDALASGWGESPGARGPEGALPSMRRERAKDPDRIAADVYLEVQRSAAFQEVRSRYRRFVVPAVVAFLGWYAAYVVAATTAPALMARPVAGAVNVAMLAGLGQFLSTFLLTWAYARHARLRRDRAALELRWDTQELTRGARGSAS